MEQNQANKKKVLAYWSAIDAASCDDMAAVAAQHLPEHFHWKGPAPIGGLIGPTALANEMLEPLKRAIPDLSRHIHLFMGGQSSEYMAEGASRAFWVASTGYLTGTAQHRFLNIPASERPLRIRWSEFIRFDEGTPVESQFIIDFVDWFEQLGLAVLPKTIAASHVFPVATHYDGVLLRAQKPKQSEKTHRLCRDLLYGGGGLNSFDQSSLSSMGMASFFHPNLKWYGPGGIGACLSFAEFEQFHQQHWLLAFPDRKVERIESLFAEGRLAAASGVAGVIATHTGPYLGVPPSGNALNISGIDFWLRRGDVFTENWVFVDMIDLFKQMGVDLFTRLAALEEGNNLALVNN